MAYTAWSVSFGEQPSAAKWNLLGANDAFFEGVVGTSATADTWSPTYNNVTVGNGTATAYYKEIGPLVFCEWNLICGTTTAVGSSVTISLPVAAAARYGSNEFQAVGVGTAVDAGTAQYTVVMQIDDSTTVVDLRYYELPTGTYIRTTTTIPFAEGAGDSWSAQWSYFKA